MTFGGRNGVESGPSIVVPIHGFIPDLIRDSSRDRAPAAVALWPLALVQEEYSSRAHCFRGGEGPVSPISPSPFEGEVRWGALWAISNTPSHPPRLKSRQWRDRGQPSNLDSRGRCRRDSPVDGRGLVQRRSVRRPGDLAPEILTVHLRPRPLSCRWRAALSRHCLWLG